MDHYDLVRSLTLEYAEKVIGNVDGLEVRFSNALKYPNAICYPYKKLIIYNNKYICLNKDNEEALKYTIIEECAHLRHLNHDDDFYNLCIELGCDVRKPPSGIKFYWRYLKRCNLCGNTKFYYHKPRKIECDKCRSSFVQLVESGL